MHFAQHAILSWFVAEAAGLDDRSDRSAVTLAGVIPDIDVLPYAGAIAWNWATGDGGFRIAMQRGFDQVHTQIHHVVTHGVFFIAITGIVAWLWKRQRQKIISTENTGASAGRVAGLCILTSFLHNACDVIASGPNWPIYPLWPFSSVPLGVSWSWTLADWPNLALLGLCLLAMRQYAVHKRRSVLETVSPLLDQRFVALVRPEKETAR